MSHPRADDLMERASAKTGLRDFGNDSFREGLDVLCEAVEKEGRLSETGARGFYRQLRQLLINRLEIESWYAQHPEIEDQQLPAPWFGLGLPRTGSSVLNNLLSQDPGRRFLRTWEAERPCPPPELDVPDDDPRVVQVAYGIELMHKMLPEFASMHETTATGPNEDGIILAHEFKSSHLEALVHVPSYTEWREQCDMTAAYRYHARFLKLLQWRCPALSWQLKSPIHLHHFEALLEVYPDARFVMTHRDPVKVLPSSCSLWSTTMALYSSEVDKLWLGEMLPAVWAASLQRVVEWREERGDFGGGGIFHDIAYQDMMRDPIGEIRGMYTAFDEELSTDAEGAMRAFLDANPKGKHGAHVYTSEEYGIDVAALREQYSFYSERFSVPTE